MSLFASFPYRLPHALKITIFCLAACLLAGCRPAISESRPLQGQLAPVAQAAALRFDSWSPDGRWAAYWQAAGEEEAATLFFFDADTQQNCRQEELQAPDVWSGRVDWIAAAQAQVWLGAGFDWLAGSPCGRFTPDPGIPPNDGRTETFVSPDGRTSAEIRVYAADGPVFSTHLTVRDLHGELLAGPFEHLDGPHDFIAGPRWLNDQVFLIGSTLDQGFLYYSRLEKQIGLLFPDLLPNAPFEAEAILKMVTYSEGTGDAYRLLFEVQDQGVWLYQTESQDWEAFPDYQIAYLDDGQGGWWGFSPDGHWLAVQAASPSGSAKIYYRGIDDQDADLAAFTLDNALDISPERTTLVIRYLQGDFDLMRFPSGQLLSHWQASDTWMNRAWFSPDGRRLVAFGSPKVTGPQTLFFGEVQP